MNFQEEPEEVLTKRTIDGAISILRDCLNSSTVKRVVYTSSAAAVSLNGRDDDVMDESFWSDVDFLRASKTHGWSYAISKTLTEKAVIEFGEQNRFKTEATKFKVVAECAGLPLAIVTISSALKGKDVAQWDHDVTGVQDAIIEEFSKSVERLEKTAESIFYHCGLIMGDNLARSNLFKHSVGIGLSEDIDKMEDVRDRVDACISKLEDLQLSQESNYGEFLTMNGFV
ncbi:hypothetical protein L6164_003711 [Bauhinia variegata]|uniref:Uncharacterized protein n=1 Tax=Bauhinia variegata TaxID=167791 RepID=A0ACB9Q4V8_BAUVA|nr:hypothetical protein L6164_003711 [Bauhinia variegata]